MIEAPRQGAGGAAHPVKEALRRRLRRARRALPAATRARAQEAVAAALLALTPRARLVAVYAAAGSELDLAPALARWEAAGVALAFPRVEGRALTWRVSPRGALSPGYRGILEPPADAPSVALAQADLVVVPGLGFTRGGARLGQGGGFYDRALAALSSQPRRPTAGAPGAPAPARLLGVAFAAQVVPWLPTEPHDQLVQGVLTDVGMSHAGVWGPLPGAGRG